MNTISPSEFPSPWDRITFLLMAVFLLYVILRFIKNGYVDWEFRLGDRNVGPKVGEKRFTRKKSPIVFWTTMTLASLGFSYCLTFTILKDTDLWISTSSILISTAIVIGLLSKSKTRESLEHPTEQ